VALPGVLVDDRDVEHLEQGELLGMAVVLEVHRHRDDVELESVAVAVRVARFARFAREVVAARVDHGERTPEVLLTVFAARQVGEVRRQTRALRGGVVLVEAGPGDAEGEVVRHGR
jgi:hypothetical protein